ncbi:nucleotidyltransferase family protein [Chryseolinea lacunae]|uniref:Nucleotidyltransferase family protein n=1 Tax=Chryseolinea lacunae TaxID=2801331 RepID=A0ABS1KT51_9BACT|nr:nucleotidyltransferase family protein [Chryseolinea lacunae]MBL0742392.1 nucleotidyltransferase family protein [Chryseolinea lacunae]
MPLKIGVVVLAAGASTRMGRSKQLLTIEAMPLLARTAKIALASEADEVTVVLGANTPAHREVLTALPVSIVENKYWEAGMGSSIKAGLQQILHTWPYIDAVLFMVCDQPEVTTHHLNDLINHYRDSNSAVVASFYSGSAGVPALFGKVLFDDLLKIEDREGAKKIIQQNANQLATIDFPEGAVDLDTPADVQKFESKK